MGICMCTMPSPYCSCRRDTVYGPLMNPWNPVQVAGTMKMWTPDEEQRLLDVLFKEIQTRPITITSETGLKGVFPLTPVQEPDPEPELEPFPPSYAVGFEDGYNEGYEVGRQNSPYVDGYKDGHEQGRLTGFEEGRLHAAKHLQEVAALQEAAAEKIICWGEISVADSFDDESNATLVICCADCNWQESIDQGWTVRQLNERLNELCETGHEAGCRED